MRIARTLSLTAAVAFVAFLGLGATAGAQTYPGGNVGDQVGGVIVERNNPQSQSQAPANTSNAPSNSRPERVGGVAVTRGETLPVTGTDVVVLSALGLGLVAAGTVVVRRSRSSAVEATA